MTDLLIDALAVWRLSSLLTNVGDSGPADIMGKLRERAGVYYDERSRCKGRNVVAQALCCLWCASVWVGWGVALVRHGARPSSLLRGLAYSAAAIWFESKR